MHILLNLSDYKISHERNSHVLTRRWSDILDCRLTNAHAAQHNAAFQPDHSANMWCCAGAFEKAAPEGTNSVFLAQKLKGG